MTEQITPETASKPSRVPNAILYVQLDPGFSTTLDYDARKATMSIECNVTGSVWNTDHTDAGFDGARVRVTFLKGIDGRMDKHARDHGLRGACGNVEIARELEPDGFKDDVGETITFPQITIWVGVDGESFGYIEAALTSCVVGNRQARMTVNFSHRTFTETFVPLQRLDLSKKTDYPIVSFSVKCFRPA